MIKVPDSKPSSKWYEKHCFDLHRKRIASIKNAPKPRLASDHYQPSCSLKSLSPTHRNLEVQRENKALLQRLAFISNSKVLGTVWTKPSWEPPLPTSLNGTFRKMEMKRIASENKVMSERLVDGKACMNFKQLEDDFKKSRKYQHLFKSAFVERHSSKPVRPSQSNTSANKTSTLAS